MACYIRHKEGDERVESGEFAETQVQRPPDQYSRIPRVYRLVVPRLERMAIRIPIPMRVWLRSYPLGVLFQRTLLETGHDSLMPVRIVVFAQVYRTDGGVRVSRRLRKLK